MRLWRRSISWRPGLRRLCAAATLVAYLLTVAGAPLSLSAAKDGRQPFPCQNHPCGCQTPEQCWQHCCCSTLEQRLAWAHEHGVEPPAYAQPEAPRGWQTARLRDRDGADIACPRACCAKVKSADPAPKACCGEHAETHSCCSHSQGHLTDCSHGAG